MTISEVFGACCHHSAFIPSLPTGYYSFADLQTLPIENTSNFEGPGQKNILGFMDSKS